MVEIQYCSLSWMGTELHLLFPSPQNKSLLPAVWDLLFKDNLNLESERAHSRGPLFWNLNSSFYRGSCNPFCRPTLPLQLSQISLKYLFPLCDFLLLSASSRLLFFSVKKNLVSAGQEFPGTLSWIGHVIVAGTIIMLEELWQNGRIFGTHPLYTFSLPRSQPVRWDLKLINRRDHEM